MRKHIFIALISTFVIAVPVRCEQYNVEVSDKSPLYKRVKQYLPGDTTETYRMRHADTFVKAGWDLFNKKQIDKALDSFFQAINMNGKHAPAYFGVAFVSSVQGNYTDAIIFYRAALHYEKKFAPIYHNLAKTLCMQNEKSPPLEVVSLLNEAIKLTPDSPDNYQTFCGYYMAKSEWILAGKMYQKALELGGKVYPDLISELKKHNVSIDVSKAKKR